MVSKNKSSLPPTLPELPSHWSWKALGELVNPDRGICYGIVQPGKHDELGVPMVNSGDVLAGAEGHQISFKVAKDLHNKFKRSTLNGGEILLTLVGANFGKASIAPDSYAGFNCSRAVGVIPVTDDAEYICIALQSDLVRYYLDTWVNTTAQPTFNLSDVANLPIAWPPKSIRDLISSQVGTISRKLDLNTQTNQTLEQMAQATFKSWFVDFDPVKAKMNGEQPEGMDAATASLFPEKLVESELGLIPEGWDAGTLSDIAKYCSARTSIDSICLNNYISTENMLADRKGVTAASKLPTAKMVAAYKAGDVLVSNIRPYFKKIWLAEGNGGRSNDVLGFESSAPNTDAYLLNLLYQDRFFEYMTRTSKGAKMPRGDKTAIMNWEMVVPPVELRKAFSAIVDKFYKLIPQNRAQNEALESLRDTLLPKLLSGEIELEQTESIVEAV